MLIGVNSFTFESPFTTESVGWIHRAKEEFDSEEGKAILADLGVEGDFEGIGHCVLGYPETPAGEGAPRKEHRVFWAE